MKHYIRGELGPELRIYQPIVEALQFHTTTHPHSSSGSTSCFPSRGLEVRALGDGQTLNGTGFLLLAMSRYIGDPDVIR